MKQTEKEHIREIVFESFGALFDIAHKAVYETNHYRATERLLRVYKKARSLVEGYDEYAFEPIGRDKSITVAPPKGGMRDHDDALEDSIAAAHRRYVRTKALFDLLDTVVALYKDVPEFIVIRMYYFNEDANGNDRGESKRYTFEEIADELATVGMSRHVHTLRSWRSKLVQDMAVLLFGIDAAISLESKPHEKMSVTPEANKPEDSDDNDTYQV